MKELSLHILDIVQNSIKAGAGKIEIIIDENSNIKIEYLEIEENAVPEGWHISWKSNNYTMTFTWGCSYSEYLTAIGQQ